MVATTFRNTGLGQPLLANQATSARPHIRAPGSRKWRGIPSERAGSPRPRTRDPTAHVEHHQTRTEPGDAAEYALAWLVRVPLEAEFGRDGARQFQQSLVVTDRHNKGVATIAIEHRRAHVGVDFSKRRTCARKAN